MRNFKQSLVVAVALRIALAGGIPTASAATYNWANTVSGNFLWSDAGHWTIGGAAVTVPPSDGDTIMFETSYSLANCGIDMAGASLYMPNAILRTGYGARNWTFYDSNTMVPRHNPLLNQTDFDPNAPYTTFVQAANASTQVLTVKQFNNANQKSGAEYFYIPVVVTESMTFIEQGDEHFYGNLSTPRIEGTRNVGWNTQVHFHGDLNVSGTFTNFYRSEDIIDGQRDEHHGEYQVQQDRLAQPRRRLQQGRHHRRRAEPDHDLQPDPRPGLRKRHTSELQRRQRREDPAWSDRPRRERNDRYMEQQR
jgi:hypothetical protein